MVEKSKKRSRPKSLFCERLDQILVETLDESIQEEAKALIKRRAVVDFSLLSSRANAKVYGEATTPYAIELSFPALGDREWSTIFHILASQSYYYSLMLCGELPREIEELMAELRGFHYPQSLTDITITVNGEKTTEMLPEVASVLIMLHNKLEQWPLGILLIAGRGYEESMLELRNRRNLHKRELSQAENMPEVNSPIQKDVPLQVFGSYEKFWAGSDILQTLLIQYQSR